MQLRRLALLVFAGPAVLSQVSDAGAVALLPIDEQTTALVAPATANVPAVQYTVSNSTPVAMLVTANPLLCTNTSAPMATNTVISTSYYSANGAAAASPKPFVFGASSAQPTFSALASGATQFSYGGQIAFANDPLGSLVCYGLDADGTHKVSPHTFTDGFDGVPYNSSVVLSVFHVPSSSTDYYGYTIDVTLPPLPANTPCGVNGLDCNFVLLEGYDTSVFDTATGGWCQTSTGSQSCPATSTFGNLNINYSNYNTGGLPSLAAPVAPASAKTYRFLAFRYFRSGVSALPASGAPVAIAALFSPNDLEENKLDDNVSAGANTVANVAPAIVRDDTFTTFSNNLYTLQENTDSGALTFNISDSDTPDTGGTPLNATVTLNIAGTSFPVTPACVTTSGAGAANRQCTLHIPLNNATYWNSSVAAGLQGLFNAVATDASPLNYAAGVSASVQIVVTDALGKASAPVSLPLHVASTVNNAPVVSMNAALPLIADSFQGGALIPTYSCSANSCGSRGYVDLLSAISAAPGPAAAFDELATQTTAVVAYAGADANGGNVQCAPESGAIFQTNLNPLVLATAVANTYEMNFFLTTTVGSSLCTVTITDAMANFPNGESPKTTARQFRIVVNP